MSCAQVIHLNQSKFYMILTLIHWLQVRGILDFGLSIETLCDEEAPDCTPEKLFEHIGDVENNPYVPFQISYVTEPLPGKIPFNRATVACNESPYVRFHFDFHFLCFHCWSIFFSYEILFSLAWHFECMSHSQPDGDRCRCADCEQSCSVTENANLIQ